MVAKMEKSTNPPETIVVIIASNLRLSRTIPVIPTIREAGREEITSSPPRAARGLPQPGRSTLIANIVAKVIPSRITDIFPKRILIASKKLVS
jgi:hypothetical protein